jgi:hypothetical protein
VFPKIKAVVMSHNQPVSTDELYRKLASCFNVTVFDSGSDEDKRPSCPVERLPNLYWTGCWREAMKRYGKGLDFLWVLGGDIYLLNEPEEYLNAMVSLKAYNVACWTPAVVGRSRACMQAERTGGRVLSVYNLEGQAMALSGAMLDHIGQAFPPGARLGWGVDIWLSWKGWSSGMRNILDGRVRIGHPGGSGYDYIEAGRECEEYLRVNVGPNFALETRMVPFLELFENNLREETR